MKQPNNPLSLFFAGASCGAALFAAFLLLVLAVTRESEPKKPAKLVVRCDTVRLTPPPPAKDTVVRYVRIPVVRPSSPSDPSSPSAPPASMAMGGGEGENRGEGAKDRTTTGAIPVGTDSVTLPISQRVYRDSLYTAWVSGYAPALDSLHIHRRTHYIYKERHTPPRRWSFGVQAGVGATPKGVLPYIGVGVQFRLF